MQEQSERWSLLSRPTRLQGTGGSFAWAWMYWASTEDRKSLLPLAAAPASEPRDYIQEASVASPGLSLSLKSALAGRTHWLLTSSEAFLQACPKCLARLMHMHSPESCGEGGGETLYPSPS